MRLIKAFLWLILVGLLVAGGTLLWAKIEFNSPGPLEQTKTLIFPRGAGFMEIADTLAREGIVRNAYVFKAGALMYGKAKSFKAGEYEFPVGVPPAAVMNMIAQGKVVIHKITVPEGLNVREISALLMAVPDLDGDMAGDIPEGSLLPETYHYIRGDYRMDIVRRMQKSMSETLDALWEKRKDGLPIKTKEEALVLASIVEKETGEKEERGRVAAVFVNRLNKGMRLQSDPTAAYGIEVTKNAPLNRALTTADLQAANAYNTYQIDRLPPAPICNPGRASIEAVMNPPDTDEFYFVATGTGGHRFAKTLNEHNRNVAAYRAVMREQKVK